MSSFCSSNFQFSYSTIDLVTCVTSGYRLMPRLKECNISYSVYLELLFKIEYACKIPNGMEQALTQLAVKILFDDSSGFNEIRRTIILPEKQT